MAFDGNGNFVLPYNWPTDKANGIKIRADRMQGQDDAIATGLTTCVTRDGQSPPTANLPMGGYKHTGAAPGSSLDDYAIVAQLQSNTATYFVATGTADAYTITPAPSVAAYVAGQAWDVLFQTANLGTTPTLQVAGLGAKNIVNSDLSSLSIGDLAAGGIKRLQYDGTRFQIVNRVPAGFSNGGTKTSGYNAAANTAYLVDATSAAFTTHLSGITTVQASVRITKFGLFPHYLAGTVNGNSAGFVIPASQEGVLEIEYTGASRGFV